MTTVTVPAESLYGLDNLPYGVYSVDGSEPRVLAPPDAITLITSTPRSAC